MSTNLSLYPGARVALLNVSSPLAEERLPAAVQAVKDLGLEPVVYPTCNYVNSCGYLAADDGQRAKELQDAFADPSVQGILCVRGGYGAGRLLPLLNWHDIAKHPKVFCGSSDVTALHIALNQHCRMPTFHTPMVGGKCWREPDEFSAGYLRRALFGALSGPLPLGDKVCSLQGGRARGVLCGGNLTLVRDSLGTPWEIDTRGKLLFLEEVHERTSRIDSMLTQLRNAGKFDQCAGILLGYWTECPPTPEDHSLALLQVIRELLLPSGKPVLAGIPCGHQLPSMSLPLGRTAVMDADAGTLEVLP